MIKKNNDTLIHQLHQKKLKDLVNNWRPGAGGWWRGGGETTKGAKLNNLIIIF